MSSSSENIVKPSAGAVASRADDEMILINVDDVEPKYFGLRGSGVRIWELVAEGKNTSEDIVRTLLTEFKAEEAVVRKDVKDTLAKLLASGLIVES